MPQVGNKKFPYTPSGIAQANQAMGRKRNIRQVVGAGNQRRPLPVKGPGVPNRVPPSMRPRPIKDTTMIPGRTPNRRTY